jgi:hypothetical protein
MDVYAAGKAEAEAASWKFVKETKPDFVVNAGKHPSSTLNALRTNIM